MRLPRSDGSLVEFSLPPPKACLVEPARWNRVAYVAAHVVADARAGVSWFDSGAIDWDTTLAYRRHLWDLGFGVAEAMDTAQRGMGLGWPQALELIRRTAAECRTRKGAAMVAGVGTDHLDPARSASLQDVRQAYESQIEAAEAEGSPIILLPSRALARAARDEQDYLSVYGRLLEQVREPVILHWLGPMFDPALIGYWGSADPSRAMDACLDLLRAHADRIDGIKLSLLDKDLEIDFRRRLPSGVRMYTGDDFNFAELIAGDESGHSDALLGILDPTAPLAAQALNHLARGNAEEFHRILRPAIPLSRKIFETPTRFYKTGVVFLAWLNGHQQHFCMLGGMQSARSVVHLSDVFRLAAEAGLLRDPELAVHRMTRLLAVWGIEP
ncbi:MAG: dihydrodipicolinate synthase family protein [Gammaproteobacteria bacterium]|nr:dihydrodipicolinate synthase family protein [Gammaproteobacteria bacterium]